MSSTTVEDIRKALGPVGVCLPVSFTDALSIDAQREAVVRLERLGYRAVWTNEVIGGKDALVQLAVLLAATERMVFGTGIANIWARSAPTAHGAAAVLAQAYPGRFVLGLGGGSPEQAAAAGREYGRPLATMRTYLAGMDSPTWPPAPAAAYPRIIAANGPKMLALAGEIADGALPAGQPPEATARARKALGPDKLLVVGVSLDADAGRDPAEVAAKAREDVAAGVSAKAGTVHDPAAVAATVREHLAAGADHVTILQAIGVDFAAGIDTLEHLAPALTEVARPLPS
jgi:probable F420-dependent oxidoreductase